MRIPTLAEMNALQDVALISDNCVNWDDVAECDRANAIAYLDSFKVPVEMEFKL